MRVRTLLALALIGAACCYGVLLFDDATVRHLGEEDGLYEYLTSLFFGVGAALYLRLFLVARPGCDLLLLRTRRNVFFLALAALFLFGCGEEISWGQRLFDIETPAGLEAANMQGEINIHNLALFHVNGADGRAKTGLAWWLTTPRLVDLFYLGFCLLLPAAVRWVRPVRRLVERVNVPTPPLALGVCFAANRALFEVMERLWLNGRDDVGWASHEIRECFIAWLFLVLAVHFTLSPQRAGQARAGD